jgi:hypothetical protein
MRQRTRRPISKLVIISLIAILSPPQAVAGETPATNSPAIPMRATDWLTAADATISAQGPDGHTSFAPPTRKTPAPKPTPAKARMTEAKKRPAEDKPPATQGPATAAKYLALRQSSHVGLPGNTIAPPDPHGAAGLNHFVEATTGTGIGIYHKSNGALASNVSLNDFFRYQAQPIHHPRVVYDKVWHRFIILAIANPQDTLYQYMFLAVSQTENPLGHYYKFAFDIPEAAGQTLDYPQLGMDQDALIITGNVFTGDTYVRSRAFGIAKAAAYNGKGWSMPYFDLGAPGTVAPPIVDGGNTNAYLIAANPGVDPNNIALFRATGLGRSHVIVVREPNVPIPGDPISIPGDARQKLESDVIDTLDGRFQNASTQIGDHVLNVATTDPDPIPAWYQINGSTGTMVVNGRFNHVPGSDDFNPSIVGSPIDGTSANPIGRMLFTWNATDPHFLAGHYVQALAADRLATDPTTVWFGQSFMEAPNAEHSPTGDGVVPWGGYSAITIDPVGTAGCPAGSRAWLVNEVRNREPQRWGTQFGRIGYC